MSDQSSSAILACIGTSGLPRRPSRVEPIDITVTLLTPLFIAGADNRARQVRQQQVIQEMVEPGCIAREGLRPASVKAALRFWWRAGFDPARGLDALRRREAELFGHVSGSDAMPEGQGAMVRTLVLEGWQGYVPQEIKGELAYLAYGCADLKGPLRPAIKPGATARIILMPRQQEHVEEIRAAVDRWLLFGNLGSKARRGYGAFSVKAWDSLEQLKEAVRRHVHPASAYIGACSWSTLWGATVLIKELPGNAWHQALNALGAIVHQFRKNLGADIVDFHAPPGDPRRYRQPPGVDHDRVANWLHGRGLRAAQDLADTLPERCGLGLPLPMQFKSGGKPVLEPVKDERRHIGDRRASPMILRLHRVGPRWYGVVTMLGGRFLPEGAHIQIREGGNKLALPAPTRPKVLDDVAQYLIQQGFVRVAP